MLPGDMGESRGRRPDWKGLMSEWVADGKGAGVVAQKSLSGAGGSAGKQSDPGAACEGAS